MAERGGGQDPAPGRTSIVLVTDSGPDETRACVAAIRQHTTAGSYELIVIDVEPSTGGGASAWPSEDGDLSYVAHDEPLTHAAALDLGIGSARYANVLCLSSHVTVTAGYLPILLTALHSDPAVGAVGPATNSIPGQCVPANYRSALELAEMVADFNRSDPARWDRRLCLSRECLLFRTRDRGGRSPPTSPAG